MYREHILPYNRLLRSNHYITHKLNLRSNFMVTNLALKDEDNVTVLQHKLYVEIDLITKNHELKRQNEININWFNIVNSMNQFFHAFTHIAQF